MLRTDSRRRTLAGRYELLAVVGRGGMGTVYRATDLMLGRTVAVKLLAGALAEDQTSVARFAREARAAASLMHPGLVAVYDSGEDEATYFIVMEYVAGRSLTEILDGGSPLAPARAVRIAQQIADALAAAHAAGIVHRDIKPGNVMVSDDGAVKVLDFGIARAMDGTTLTHRASMVGTAAYMAPERALGKAADARADIYSLGCVLYAMLTGRPPFEGEAAAAILHQHLNATPRAPREINRLIRPPLDALVMQMLAKSPAVRPASAALVSDRLGQTLSDTSSAQPRAATAPTVRLDAGTLTRVLGGRLPAGRRSLLAAALTAAALLALALLFAGGSSSPKGVGAQRLSLRKAPSSAARRVHLSATAPAAKTVAQAAGAMTSLITADAEAGALDGPAARQLNARLANVLGDYAAGSGVQAQHDLLGLSQALLVLAQAGHISTTALSPLQADVGVLAAALVKQPPRGVPLPAVAAPARVPPALAQNGSPPGHGGVPPGHGGKPPGQTRKHGDAEEGGAEGD